jgi:hypothetical protein
MVSITRGVKAAPAALGSGEQVAVYRAELPRANECEWASAQIFLELRHAYVTCGAIVLDARGPAIGGAGVHSRHAGIP